MDYLKRLIDNEENEEDVQWSVQKSKKNSVTYKEINKQKKQMTALLNSLNFQPLTSRENFHVHENENTGKSISVKSATSPKKNIKDTVKIHSLSLAKSVISDTNDSDKPVQKQSTPHLIKSHDREKKHARHTEFTISHLINKLNYINFLGDTIMIKFRHIKYGRIITRHVKPQLCDDYQFKCLWSEASGLPHTLKPFKLEKILVPDGRKLLMSKPEVLKINKYGLTLKLPETCYEINLRKIRRYPCKQIHVQLIQNSAVFYGTIKDFNAVSMRITIQSAPDQSFQWINPSSSVNLIITEGENTLFTGKCKITRQTCGHKNREYVLFPVIHQIHRFKPEKNRSIRHLLTPSPDIVFTHPITHRRISLKTIDLSCTGFSVEEEKENSVLLPGMIIHSLTLCVAGNIMITCKAQVIYRNKYNEKNKTTMVKCGLAILDVGVEDHTRLLSCLNQIDDNHSYISNNVDPDMLWELFFKSGFIYPNKYIYIYGKSDRIKKTYRKLYFSNPKITRHFYYQHNGIIQRHVSLLHLYENSWMIHNHASKSSLRKDWLSMLKQVARCSCDSQRFSSIHFNYLINYFSHENDFSKLVFKGTADYIKDLKGCSLDTFSHFSYQRLFDDGPVLPKPWKLTNTCPEDLHELNTFYEHQSGGLMVKALDLDNGNAGSINLAKKYNEYGLKFSRRLISLKKNNILKAIFILNTTDICLNMNDLTNTLQIIVLDPDDLPRNILFLVISFLSERTRQNEISVLLYPSRYTEDQAITINRKYTLWVLNTLFSDKYYKHIDLMQKIQN